MVEIDQNRRLGQAEVHGGNQALATGQYLGIVAILGQVGQGLIHCGWGIVFEGGWLHVVSTS